MKSKYTIKAWAIINETLTWHEFRPMIYMRKKDAKFNCYQGYKVVPCKIILTPNESNDFKSKSLPPSSQIII